MNYINLDFCIIENPLDKTKRPIIFVTRKGRQYLDETVINEDDYEKAIFAIQNIGYVESDILTFEFSQDPDFPRIEVPDIKNILEKKGMRYSQELEETIKGELEILNLNGTKQLLQDIAAKADYKEESKRNILQAFKIGKCKIPEIGEKLSLYFYLFIECKFSGDKCYLNLNGDFTSKSNSDLRNYLLPFKCDFIRINNVYNPNKIILKSCKTNREILKKLPINYGGSFNLKIKEKNLLIDKLFVYYLMEVKNNLPQENRITIEIDTSSNFDQMISISKDIKEHYESLSKSKYDIDGMSEVLERIKEILKSKMLNLSDEEEYERAAKIKKDIKYVEGKIEKLKLVNVTSVPFSQYVKTFHIN